MTSGAEMRIYSRAQYGQLVSLTMLNAQQYKSPQVCTRDGKPVSSTVILANCAQWSSGFELTSQVTALLLFFSR